MATDSPGDAARLRAALDAESKARKLAELELRREREKTERERAASNAAAIGAGAGALARPTADTAEGRAALADAALSWMWALLHGAIPGTNMDRLAAAKEMVALGGYRRAAPATREEPMPLGTLLARPSDSQSGVPSNATPGGATTPASGAAPVGGAPPLSDPGTGGAKGEIATESDVSGVVRPRIDRPPSDRR